MVELGCIGGYLGLGGWDSVTLNCVLLLSWFVMCPGSHTAGENRINTLSVTFCYPQLFVLKISRLPNSVASRVWVLLGPHDHQMHCVWWAPGGLGFNSISTSDFYVPTWLGHGSQMCGQMWFWIFLEVCFGMGSIFKSVEFIKENQPPYVGGSHPISWKPEKTGLLEQWRILWVDSLWTWTAASAVLWASNLQPTLQILDLTAFRILWVNSLIFFFFFLVILGF
jgi:hypothetical protein